MMYIETETANLSTLVMQVKDGTQEGLFQVAKDFIKAGFGSILILINEFGLYLLGNDTTRKQFLSVLYEAYDGKFSNKCIKSEKREADIENIPTNAILFSSPKIFKDLSIKVLFDILMQTGLIRRLIISFKSDENLIYDNISDTEERELKNKKKDIGEKLISLFYDIDLNSCYIVEAGAIEIRNEYKKWLIEQYNATCEEERIEIISREYKAMKLSCIYASLNHPKEHKIEVKDIKQAIISVQYLSEDFKAFKKYLQRKENDEYDKCYNFFKENVDKPFSKTELKTR